ncbi:MAG: hypothetical protein LBD38_02360 [Streptococcaceae bacterium]|jgi:hypothetical protein|nr:hypothetical protein [Streptococcaceae bacterium]
MNEKFEKVQFRLIDIKDSVSYFYDEKKRLFHVLLGGLLLLVVMTLLIFPIIQQNIREDESNYLFSDSFSGIENVEVLSYKSDDATIRKAKAITVIFVRPNTKVYENLSRALQTKNLSQSLNRKVYLYIVAYDTAFVSNRYQLNIEKDVADIVLFVDGVENNRMEISPTTNLDPTFSSKLNTLALSGGK